jgi:hypothetical protein
MYPQAPQKPQNRYRDTLMFFIIKSHLWAFWGVFTRLKEPKTVKSTPFGVTREYFVCYIIIFLSSQLINVLVLVF